MTIILFIAVLVALIVVHEFGHFVVAKLSGMRVDEFGIGYPPRALTFAKKGDTEYTLNWLPFGGFVKIYGEDEQDRVEKTSDSARAFASRPRVLQALVLVAGIAMNLFFAYVLIVASLLLHTPQSLSQEEVASARDVRILVADTLSTGPATKAGIMPGDELVSAQYGEQVFTGTDAEQFSNFIASDSELEPIDISIRRDGEEKHITVVPETSVVPSDLARPALGVSIAVVGILDTSFFNALVQGARITWSLTEQTAIGLAKFFASAATLSANLSHVSGPVGIAGAVGDAGSHGITALMALTAIISINLALINILPIPALDGGRLLFVIIEGIIRRPIPASVGRAVNGIGFLFLILLMLVVTANDIFKLFS